MDESDAFVKSDIGQDQEIVLLALSMIAYSKIVRWDIGIDLNERPIVTVNIFGSSLMVHFINLVLRKLTRVVNEKLAAIEHVVNDQQKTSFMLGVAGGILNQAIDVDNKRNYLNAFEQAVEHAKNEPQEMYLDEGVRMPVTTRQIASVLDEAKKADAMSYKLGAKFGEGLDVYKMFVDVAKMQKDFANRAKMTSNALALS